MIIFVLFIVWKIVDILTSIAAPTLIPYLGFFPYKELLADYKLPAFLSSFASFDGTQYLTLVREGYNMYTQAYFPLYFLLVRLVSELFPMFQSVRIHNDLVASLLVSNVSFLLGFILFKKYLTLLFPKEKSTIIWTALFLLFFPTSFFFGAVYTEGLFFLLFIGSLYFLKKKNYLMAGLFGALSSATRLMGVFLIIPFFLDFISKSNINLVGGAIGRDPDSAERSEHWREEKSRQNLLNLVYVFTPLVGFISYALYLWKTVGDPFFFFNAQPIFGAHRSTHLILLPQVYYRYLKILLTAQWNFQYFTSLIEVVFFTFIFILLSLDLRQILKDLLSRRPSPINNRFFTLLSLNIFSFINLILPTLTGTFSSIPRYALFSISAFLYLGKIKNIRVKIILLSILFIFHIVLLGFFIQGYFVG